MPSPQEPQKKEQPSTYFVQDRQNEEELLRLTFQDRLLTAGMGGVLPEQADPGSLRRVLDVGCGSGSWIIEAAQSYPDISLLAGIDISQRMVEYAHGQAEAAHVTDRVEFHVMDALLLLNFPPGFFDLVNLRLGSSFLRTWDWPKMLSELQRVTRRGGVVRVTDTEIIILNNSPALRQWQEMVLCAFYRAGHLFVQESTGLTTQLSRLLTQHGCKQVQTKAYAIGFGAGTAEGQAYYENMMHVFHTIRPFLKKWGCISSEYDAITQQALEEMQHPDFWATWNLHTAWGINPNSARYPRRD